MYVEALWCCLAGLEQPADPQEQLRHQGDRQAERQDDEWNRQDDGEEHSTSRTA